MSEKSQVNGVFGTQNSVLACFDRGQKMHRDPHDEEMSFLRLNQIGNSDRLIQRFGQNMAFVAQLGWLCWNGKFWDRVEGNNLAIKYAKKTAVKLYDEANSLTIVEGADPEDLEKFRKNYKAWAKSSCSLSGVNAMLDLARPELAVKNEEFDQSDYAIAVQNAVVRIDGLGKNEDGRASRVDIQSYIHQQSDMNTQICDVDYRPEAVCPRWRTFVSQILPDPELASYFQKTMGYSFLGDRSEQIATFLHGDGSDGKSTAIAVMRKIAGSYGKTVGIRTFLYDRLGSGSGPSPDLAGLPGVRFVTTSEPNIGVRLDEEVLKIFTGGEEVSARKLQKDFFEFEPKCHIVFSLNHRPTITGKDFGIKRRIRIIPFEQSFGKPNADGTPGLKKCNQKELIAELLAERDGIFNWLLDGIRMLMVDGFEEPEKVKAAKEAWFMDNDPISQFLAECTQKDKGKRILSPDLYDAYESWCSFSLNDRKGKRNFSLRIGDLGFASVPCNGKYYRKGLTLNETWRANITREDMEDIYRRK